MRRPPLRLTRRPPLRLTRRTPPGRRLNIGTRRAVRPRLGRWGLPSVVEAYAGAAFAVAGAVLGREVEEDLGAVVVGEHRHPAAGLAGHAAEGSADRQRRWVAGDQRHPVIAFELVVDLALAREAQAILLAVQEH